MQRLIDVWAGVERSVDDGIEHAYACLRATGGHFE